MANFAFMPPLTSKEVERLSANMPAPEPAKLYCPAHGKMDPDVNQMLPIEGKNYCGKCVASALERIGVHQLTEKVPEVKKGW